MVSLNVSRGLSILVRCGLAVAIAVSAGLPSAAQPADESRPLAKVAAIQNEVDSRRAGAEAWTAAA